MIVTVRPCKLERQLVLRIKFMASAVIAAHHGARARPNNELVRWIVTTGAEYSVMHVCKDVTLIHTRASPLDRSFKCEIAQLGSTSNVGQLNRTLDNP